MAPKKLIACFLFTLFTSSPVFAGHDSEPIYKKGDAECSIWGYSNVIGGSKRDFMADQIRTETSCKYKSFSFFMENDIAGLNDRIPANYITQAWVGYNFGKAGLFGNMFSDTTIRAGSLVTAARLYQPAAYATIPIEDPTNPFHPYGYGVQIQTKITPNLTFVGDITGATGLPFDNPRRFEGTETSQRLAWDAVHDKETGRTKLQLSLFHQWSAEADKIGFGAKYSPTENLELYGGVYHMDEHAPSKKPGESNGGYVLADQKVWSMKNNKLDLRVMGMVEKTTGKEDYTGVSVGPSLVLPKNGGYGRLTDSSVTVDLTHSKTSIDGGPQINDNAIMTRFRIFF